MKRCINVREEFKVVPDFMDYVLYSKSLVLGRLIVFIFLPMQTKLGIDIGSHTIKLVEMARDGQNFTVVAAGTAPTPPKALASPLEADQKALGSAIAELVKTTKVSTRSVAFALPESLVFTRVIEVPQLTDQELASAMRWESEQYIPLPLDQVNIDYSILRGSKELGKPKMEVLLVASPKNLVEKYVKIMDYANLHTIAAETEIISISRALVRVTPMIKNVMIVSLGAQTTDLAILRSGVLAFTRSISAGGEALSRALVQNLDFNKIQAEEYKLAYGLEKDKLQGKILTAVKPIMDTIISEIKRATVYYQEKYQDKIEVVVICGGTAKLPGMVLYIAEETGLETQLANPWLNIQMPKNFAQIYADGPSFCVAVGLTIRS